MCEMIDIISRKYMYIWHNPVSFSTHDTSIWRKTTFFIQWTHLDTVIKTILIFKYWSLSRFTKTWQVLKNGLMAILWL